jgi:hypothetical protein
MHDCVAAGGRSDNGIYVLDVANAHLQAIDTAFNARLHLCADLLRATECDDLVSCVEESGEHMAPNETRCAGE